MLLTIFTEPQQGAEYDQLLRVATTADACGFDGFFRSDHFLKMGDVSGLPGPTDAWITLAGLARETTRIKLGTLVTSATFRLPGPLAVAVATVDRMSGGRVELGIGAGWYDTEHTSYGIPFPSTAERMGIEPSPEQQPRGGASAQRRHDDLHHVVRVFHRSRQATNSPVTVVYCGHSVATCRVGDSWLAASPAAIRA